MKKVTFFIYLCSFANVAICQSGCLAEFDTIFTPYSEPNPKMESIVANEDGSYWITGGSLPDDSVFHQGYVLTGQGDLYLIRFNAQHNIMWDKRGVTTGFFKGLGNSVSIDDEDNAYLGGYYEESLTIEDEEIGSTNGGARNPFVAKFDPQGNLVWLKRIHTPGLSSSGQVISVASDNLGNVFFGGTYSGSLSNEVDTITSWAFSDNFWGKLDGNGELEWIKAAGSNSIERGMNVAADESGNLYTFGYVNNLEGLNDSVYVDTIQDFQEWGFVAKYSNSGVMQWLSTSQMGAFTTGHTTKEGGRITVKDGMVAITGKMASDENGEVQIAGVAYATPEPEYVATMAMALDTSGNGLWLTSLTHYLGSPNSGIAVDILDNGTVKVIVDRGPPPASSGFIGPIPLYFTIDSDGGNILSSCYATQFTFPLPRSIASYGNSVLVAGIFGDSSLQIKGLFVSGLNTTVTGTNEQQLINDIRIFPNPTDGAVQIELNQSQTPLRTVGVFDLHGRKVYLNETFNNTETQTFQLGNLDPGIYVLSITLSDGRVISKKVAIR